MAKEPINVVDISSSDDEVGAGGGRRKPALSRPASLRSGPQGQKSGPNSQRINSLSFWKAGDYDIGSTNYTTFQGHLEHARVHPKFLHSNATSHKWAFGAIAELLDNAVDEICNGATFVKVDRIYNTKDNSPALLFQDDGGGMDPDRIRKCMSLGYSSKKSNTTIGQYGNGFKTSTMRLGADVILFSRATRPGRATQSVGLLSYTFLRTTGQDDVVVPMVDFDISDHWAEPIIYSSEDDWSSNLKTILDWSPFPSKEELMLQFEDVGSHGTKIIIYNLWLNDEGIFELSFDDDDEDIRLRDETNRGGLRMNKRAVELQSHISYRIRYSLRAYASILYLRKFMNFSIILRGKPIEQFNIADELKYPKVVVYRPQLATTSKEVTAQTTIGFIKEAPALGIHGYNVYHKNRLIKPFWRLTTEGTSRGNGVVGVLEANFIEPAHDKQDFERSPLFLRLENKLKQMLFEYWNSHCHLLGLQPPNVQRKYPVQGSVGVTTNVVEQPIVGLAANLRPDIDKRQSGSGCRVSIRNELSAEQPISGLAGSFNEAISVDNSSGPTSIDQICEENIQLFMRCEEGIQKQNELKQMVQKLEEELNAAKTNCAQLSSLVELRKKQQNGKKQSGRA